MKKIILGRSDAWSMSHLSHWPSKPAFYIDDCQISGRGRTLWNSTIYMKCGRNGWWQSWYVMSFFLMLSHSSLAHPSLALVCLMLDREGPPKSRVKKCICISSQSATLRTIKYKNVYVYGVACHRCFLKFVFTVCCLSSLQTILIMKDYQKKFQFFNLQLHQICSCSTLSKKIQIIKLLGVYRVKSLGFGII